DVRAGRGEGTAAGSNKGTDRKQPSCKGEGDPHLHAQQSRRAPSIGMLRVSFFGGLIQAAVGRTGGFGTTPLKRMGWAANAASSVIVRCSVRAAAVPSWTAAGGMKPIPL